MVNKQRARGFHQEDWMDPLYLNLLLTEEEKLIKKTANDYCNSKLLPRVIKDNKKCFFDKKIYLEFGSLGFLGSTIKGYGAAKTSNVAYGLVAKEFESIDSGYPWAISVQSSLVIHPIYYFGSDEQKQNYLPELINGSLVGCFGLTESEAGSDPSSMKTSFTEVSDGYIINGIKNWITNAHIADVFIIWALSKEKKVHGFIVNRKSRGLTTSMIEKASLKISPTGQIILNNVKVPKNNILPSTQGWKSVYSCLNKARYGIAWGVMGAAESSWLIAKNYAENRVMFNKQLAVKQLIQKKLANMQTEISLALSACLHTGRAMDENKDAKIAIGMLKRNNCNKALRIVRDARDMLGANGLLDEYHIIRHLINLEAVNTYEGTADIHALILGKFQTKIDAF